MYRLFRNHIVAHLFLVLAFISIVPIENTNAESKHASSNFKALDLRCEDRINPIGIDDASPDFSWSYGSQNIQSNLPTHYQILVASDPTKLTPQKADLWNSGKAVINHGAVPYKGKHLRSRQIAYWTVRIWDSSGQVSKYAEFASFELGLLDISDWKASWIWSDLKDKDDSIYLGRNINRHNVKIIRARLYITASQRYEIFLNGKQLEAGPNFGDTIQRYYKTVAIDPDLFNSDPNELNFLAIRAHWFGSGQGRPDLGRGVLMRMELLYSDGKVQEIVSDKDWLSHKSEWYLEKTAEGAEMRYRNSECVPFESIDARIINKNDLFNNHSDWKAAAVLADAASGLGKAKLVAQTTAIEEEVINPLSVKKLGEGYYLADFGKIYAATPIVNFPNGISGSKINISAAYHLDNSGKAITSEQRTDLSYRYIMNGNPGGEIFKPFWYLGMRYLAVENSPVELQADNIKLSIRKNATIGPKATFSSSDSILNNLWELAVHSATYGAQEQFIDTPTREQGQFSYDAYLIGTALAEISSERLLNKQALREFSNSQARFDPQDGRIDAAYPNGGVVQEIADWTMIWPIWAWEFYKLSYDQEVIFDLYPKLIKTAHWVESKINKDTDLIDLGNSKNGESGFVDWPDRYNYDLSTSQRTVMNAYAIMLFDAVSELSAVVDNKANKEHFYSLGKELKNSIKSKLWSRQLQGFIDGIKPDGTLSAEASEQTNAMMLALGIADSNQVKGALARINEASPSTSVVMSRFLVMALGEQHQTEKLLNYLRIPNGRNFAQILKEDGTYTYESWSGRNSSTGEGESESHGYGAFTLINALLKYVAGIKCEGVGCRSFLIYPHFSDIAWVNAQLPTSTGLLTVNWKGPHNLVIEVPLFSKGSVCLPVKAEENVTIYLNDRPVSSKKIDNCFLIENIESGRHEIHVN